MDLEMPVMDGLHATRAIRQIAPALSVVGQTAHAMAEYLQTCRDAGMVATITKPIDHDQLVATIRRHARPAPLGGAPAGSAPSSSATQHHEAPASTAAPLVDWRRLAQRHLGRQPFMRHLLKVALRSLEPAPALLRTAAEAADLPALTRLAHRIKGSSGELFAQAVFAQALSTEQSARATTAPAEATAQALHLAALVDLLLVELRHEVANRAGADGGDSSSIGDGDSGSGSGSGSGPSRVPG
jgi:HPt (histidine-containing phosphotransfer) domain-containing protein